MKRFLAVFVASFVTDIVWTITVLETSGHHLVGAIVASVILVYVAGYATLRYVKEPRLLHAVALGSAAGTAVAMTLF